MIHVYRASIIEVPEEQGEPTVPVLVVWGKSDAFFPPTAAELTAEFAGPDGFALVPDATHWILLEEPELTSQKMIEFFSAP